MSRLIKKYSKGYMEDTKDKSRGRLTHAGYSNIWRKAVKGEIDGRSLVARAIRDLKESLIRELGGVDNITVQKTILLDRAVAKTFQCQLIERMLYEGEEIGKGLEDLYLNTANSLRKDLTVLGLNRIPKNVTEVNMNELDLKKLSIEELKVLETLIRKMEQGTTLTPQEEAQLNGVLSKQHSKDIPE